ncbi:MAG: tyrosine--tRNA ligase [Thermofilaceae archaeon]|nr:tyrosine--tRNA ligase [Thermofilaceae archaeon]MCX8180686.1 tyrosine--tRNA ligase [Thermofilaceae archaeon]MDW8003790.1 tyrosine--tRNA ligase [Thermofilaceae archaeon]
MDVETLIKWVTKEPTEEVLTVERLREYVENGIDLRHYIGFEISGLVHLGTGLLCMQKVADLQKAGIKTSILLADYHSWINKKLGSDLSTIKRVAGGYFKDALKVSLRIVGGDPDNVEFVIGSELYDKIGIEYLTKVVRVSMETSLSRIRRSVTIMGRRMGESLSFAQLLYVPMQVADIFSLNVNIAHGGMDQRKAHVIAIESGLKVGGYIPIALHHHLLTSMNINEKLRESLLDARLSRSREKLEEAVLEAKMSKSRPQGAIFIHDSPDEVRAKIKEAYCPPKQVELNPVLELVKYILFRDRKEPLEVLNRKSGVKSVYNTFDELALDYAKGNLHPLDLKLTVADELSQMLEPAYRHFREGPGRKYLEELKEIQITR